jgi:hypothetical protein
MMCRHSPRCWSCERRSKNYCRHYRPRGCGVQCWKKKKIWKLMILLSLEREEYTITTPLFGVRACTLLICLFSIHRTRISTLDLTGSAILCIMKMVTTMLLWKVIIMMCSISFYPRNITYTGKMGRTCIPSVYRCFWWNELRF